MVGVGPDTHEATLELPHARRCISPAAPCEDMVFVAEEGLSDDHDLHAVAPAGAQHLPDRCP